MKYKTREIRDEIRDEIKKFAECLGIEWLDSIYEIIVDDKKFNEEFDIPIVDNTRIRSMEENFRLLLEYLGLKIEEDKRLVKSGKTTKENKDVKIRSRRTKTGK